MHLSESQSGQRLYGEFMDVSPEAMTALSAYYLSFIVATQGYSDLL